MNIKRLLITTIVTSIFFFAFEFFSYLILHSKFKNYSMPAMERFSLFTLKSTYHDPMKTSFFYNYRFKDNLANTRKEFPKTSVKGLLDEYYIINNIDHVISKDNQSFDIYLFGGSTIFLKGDYNSIGKEINSYLDNEKKSCSNLYSSYPKGLRVITAGHSGYATINQINRLITDIIPLKPEMVIFFDGINDFIMGHSLIDYTENDTIHEKYYLRYIESKKNFSISLLADLPDRFYSIFLINKAFKKYFDIQLYKNTAEQTNFDKFSNLLKLSKKNKYNNKAFENYKNNHFILEALADKFNFIDLHLLQPTLADAVENLNLDKNIYNFKWPDPENILDKDDKIKVSKFWYNKTVLFWKDAKKFFKEKSQDNYLDYSDLMNNLDISNVYYDLIHYDDTYSKGILSKAIAEDILKTIKCD